MKASYLEVAWVAASLIFRVVLTMSRNPLGVFYRVSGHPLAFSEISDPITLSESKTYKENFGRGCETFGGQNYADVEKTKVHCTVLGDIECFGERRFLRGGFPCIRYGNHYFLSTLLYSIFLGFLGLDRFCLGHTGTAVGKVLTLGGVGIWWMVDIILLITGGLQPEDGTNWVPYA
nr:EOG090X0IT6 [Artemia franciscana]